MLNSWNYYILLIAKLQKIVNLWNYYLLKLNIFFEIMSRGCCFLSFQDRLWSEICVNMVQSRDDFRENLRVVWLNKLSTQSDPWIKFRRNVEWTCPLAPLSLPLDMSLGNVHIPAHPILTVYGSGRTVPWSTTSRVKS